MCAYLPTQSTEWRSSINSIRQFICNHWGHSNCAVNSRAGLYVCMNTASGSSLLTTVRDPVVGAQYRWSAAFAPSNPEFWGLFQGWITVLGWVTTSAAVPILLANVVTGLAVFNNESYVVKPWHTTLLMWAFIVLCVVPNFWCRKLFNTFEVIGAICHFVMFIASIIIFATLGKWGPSSFVFDTLIHDVSGWANPAVCWGIGLMTLAFPLSGKSRRSRFYDQYINEDMAGFDGTIHMS